MKFLESLQSRRNAIPCCLVIDKVGTVFGNKTSESTRRILATIIIWLILFIFEIILMILLGNSLRTIVIPTSIASLVPSLSIFIVSWSYSFTYRNLERAVQINPIGENLEKSLIGWWEKSASLQRQLLTSFVMVIISIIIIISLFFSGNFPILNVLNHQNQGLFEAILFSVFIVFWGGQGIYWGWILPNMTKILNKNPLSEMGIYHLNPTKSPFLNSISDSFSFLALEVAAMVTLAIVGTFTLQPEVNNKFTVPISILLLGYFVSSWTFFYPQFHLSAIVKLSKKTTIINIQKEIEAIYNNLHKIKSTDFKRLEDLLKLQDHVSKAPNSFISLSAWRNFIGSLLTPTVVALIGLVDWSSILKSIESIVK